MSAARLLAERLANQRLRGSTLRTPANVVSWFGALQAQDFAGARWAIGQRMPSATDAAVTRAFDDGTILRTHVMRPTWHFVAPADLRWLLALTAPRVHACNAPYYRRNELDARTLSRGRRVLERALEGGNFLTRSELAQRLARASITADGERLAYVMMHAELEAVICSGPRKGRQFTYALVDERARQAKRLPAEEALATLTRRYFASHGPATIRDFAWWSGLTKAIAKTGLEMLGRDVESEDVDGVRYWRVRPARRAGEPVNDAHLLPNYDEFLIAYQDRQLSVDAARTRIVGTRGGDAYIHQLVVDGRLAGSWRPTTTRGRLDVSISTYQPATRTTTRAIASATKRYLAFVGRTS
jgi:DNA glycosylase AlkZ-like